MSEPQKTLKVVETVKPAQKAVKFRTVRIMPSDIVESWRLLDRSIRETKPEYPDVSEESPEKIRAHLFQYLSSQGFIGLMAKVGRRPVAQIIGGAEFRPFGRPDRVCFIWNFWVEPECRKSGVMKKLAEEYFSEMKKAGIFYWEANVSDDLLKMLEAARPNAVSKRFNVAGGKV